jgi:eukaryotic-like serine/threonine-protein kinase
MNAERPATRIWREALAHMDLLLQQPHEQRAHVLSGLAQSQPQLHSIVQSLLEAEREADNAGFLEPPPRDVTRALKPDALIGPYRIVEALGAGGMGEVWLATREDGLYRGDVAIKTLHPYFAGGALRERFLREANLLGQLSHPNIARLLDAGVAADGGLYLVLEYVCGASIDTWCDARKLGIESRLRLFLDVCAAVAHAHSHLIVHRDLKPANILVTDEGQVKLLDFGIAKLVEADVPVERTELTRMTGRIFTPEYAAPEQILGEPITTATDVYSLGVLLHVLLTGTRPYGSSQNAVEIERAVLHDEPVRASRAIAAAANSKDAADARSTTSTRLQRALAGDIDTIISHAAHKAPLERYESVLAFADDVRRHLEHRPILARPERIATRSRKFVRRHRAGVAASALVVAALTAGLTGVLWQAQIARDETRKATAIKDFLLGVFERNSTAHPDGARARKTTAEELLAQSAEAIRTGLTDAPEIRAELLGVMGNLYAALEMQKEALPLLEERLVIQRRELGNTDSAVARTLSDLSMSRLQNGDYPAAERDANEALQIFRANGDESALEHALAYVTLAQVSYRLGTTQDGRMRRYFETARDLLAEHHPRSYWRVKVETGLSRVAQNEGNHEQALKHNEEAMRLFESGAVDADGIVRGAAYQSLGNGLNWVSRNDEAEHYLRKAIAEYEKAGGPEHPYTTDGRRELGAFLGWIGRREQAKAELQAALETQVRARGDADPQLTTVIRVDLGRVLMIRGEYAAAERELQRVIDAWQISGAPTITPQMHLARIHTEQGRFDAVVQELDDIEAKVVKVFGKGSWGQAAALNRLAALSLAQGKLQDARDTFNRTLAEAQDAPGELGPNRAYAEVGLVRIALAQQQHAAVLESGPVLISRIESARARGDMPDEEAAAHMLLGVALVRADKVQEAQPHLEQAVTMREPMDAPESLLLAEARLYLAQQRHLAGQRAAARELVVKAADAFRMQASVGPQYRQLLAQTRQITAL